MAATDPNDSISPNPSVILNEEDTAVSLPNSSTAATTHMLAWKDALQYTCRTNATLMATPQTVVETIHARSQRRQMQYRVADLPTPSGEAHSESRGTMEEFVMASQTQRAEFVTWIRQRMRESMVLSEKEDSSASSSTPMDLVGRTCATVLHSFWAVCFVLSFLWSNTSESMKIFSQQLMQLFLLQANDYTEALAAPSDPTALPLCSSSSSSQEWEGVKTPDPVILSAFRSRNKEQSTPGVASLMSPSRLFTNDIMTPNRTSVAWNEPFVSVELLLDSLQYIRKQLHLRRKSYLTHRDPSVDTIVSVHSVRKWLRPPSHVVVDTASSRDEVPAVPSSRSEKELRSSPLTTPSAVPTDDNGTKIPMAEFLEQIADSQLEWLLSFITCTNTETPNADADVCLLQRLDRESHAVGGGSVYVLQLPPPENTVATRLAFYDVQQSIATIQAKIAQWESSLTTIQKDIVMERKNASTTNPSPKLLRLLQRYKLYRQHKEQGEATLLNLYTVQCSLEHTVQVQQPTVVALQQAKHALQSLRPKDRAELEELVDEIRDLVDDDPLDILCKEETHMDTDEMQQLEEELLQLQLQDLPCAPSGFPKVNTPASDGSPVASATPNDVDQNVSPPCT